MNTRKAMSEAIAVLDAPGRQGVGRTMYLKTRWTKVEEPSRSGRLLSRAGGQDTCKRVLQIQLQTTDTDTKLPSYRY